MPAGDCFQEKKLRKREITLRADHVREISLLLLRKRLLSQKVSITLLYRERGRILERGRAIGRQAWTKKTPTMPTGAEQFPFLEILGSYTNDKIPLLCSAQLHPLASSFTSSFSLYSPLCIPPIERRRLKFRSQPLSVCRSSYVWPIAQPFIFKI